MSLIVTTRRLITAVLATVLATVLVAAAGAGAQASPAPPRGDSGPPLVADRGARIVGGTDAVAADWPGQVALLRSDVQNGYAALACGGTLIAARWVLTAGHCLGPREIALGPTDLHVAVGIADLSAIRPQDRVPVVEVYRHPGYSFEEAPVATNDAALLHLAAALPGPYTPLIGPEQDGRWGPGSIATAVGWGNTSEGGARPDHLRQVDVPVISDRDCLQAYPTMDAASIVCAGYVQGRKDACQGDSGGPLMVPVDGRWFQVGTVSGGLGCARRGYPGGYGDVAVMRGWIVLTIDGRHVGASMS